MGLPDSPLMRPQQPALQQSGHAMHTREVPVEALRVALGHRFAVPVAQSLQPGVTGPPLGANGAARLHRIQNEGFQAGCRRVRDMAETDPANALPGFLRSHRHHFLSRLRKPYTRFGVYRLVERCAARVPSLEGRRVTPHVVRHTSACHLMQAGVELNTIRAGLGHVSLDTTNVYAEVDLQTKAKATAICDAAEPVRSRPWKKDKGLIAFLKSL